MKLTLKVKDFFSREDNEDSFQFRKLSVIFGRTLYQMNSDLLEDDPLF